MSNIAPCPLNRDDSEMNAALERNHLPAPSICWANAWNSLSESIGLVRHVFMPASKHLSSVSACTSAVSAMIGIVFASAVPLERISAAAASEPA